MAIDLQSTGIKHVDGVHGVHGHLVTLILQPNKTYSGVAEVNSLLMGKFTSSIEDRLESRDCRSYLAQSSIR